VLNLLSGETYAEIVTKARSLFKRDGVIVLLAVKYSLFSWTELRLARARGSILLPSTQEELDSFMQPRRSSQSLSKTCKLFVLAVHA